MYRSALSILMLGLILLSGCSAPAAPGATGATATMPPPPRATDTPTPTAQVVAVMATDTPVPTSTAAPVGTITVTLPPPPTLDPNLPPPVSLVGGAGHTCLLSGGVVRCWGAGQFGQVGTVLDGMQSMSGEPFVVDGLPADIIALAAGYYHTCALTLSAVWCWGANDTGQLGTGATSADPVPTPVRVQGADGGVAIDATGGRTCVITSDGQALCWGEGMLKPTPVTGLAGRPKAVSAGFLHACALLENGRVQCWGAGGSGQLGHGSLSDSAVPVEVQGLPATIQAISVGGFPTCALAADGSVWCWGGSAEFDFARAAQIQGLAGPAKEITVGDGHACALLEDGQVQCWGDNWFGQIRAEGEPGSGFAARGEPVTQEGIQGTVVSISAGGSHTCALIEDGSILCWGDRTQGALGDGSVRWK